MSKPVVLIIMDGWGLGTQPQADAIQHAQVPFVNSLYQRYPHSTLITCGEEVGLPEGQMGNSEVGHLNIGAGRIVYQELQRINLAVKTGELATNTTLLAGFEYAKNQGKKVHFIGLVSDGGVHSHINHLNALLALAQTHQLPEVYVHAFTDGRDCDPKSGKGFIEALHQTCVQTGVKIASVTGRYYAMDRDKRWERVALAYQALVHGTGTAVADAAAFATTIEQNYTQGTTDEFLKPLINASLQGAGNISADDVVICFNFRTDRCREITEVLTQQALPDYGMQPLPLHYITMTEYDATFKNVQVLFYNDNLTQTLGEVLAQHGKTQIRLAETEKYPHVTFFFSGGREQPFDSEKRLMAASPKVATYDLQPEMSAHQIVNLVVPELQNNSADFVCINFANADMVGHTGVFSAVVKAVETVDACVKQVTEAALASNYTVCITADHGNADFMINEDGSPNTQHSLNLVPFFVVAPDVQDYQLRDGKLGDIAPTILQLMGLEAPKEMTGKSLLAYE